MGQFKRENISSPLSLLPPMGLSPKRKGRKSQRISRISPLSISLFIFTNLSEPIPMPMGTTLYSFCSLSII